MCSKRVQAAEGGKASAKALKVAPMSVPAWRQGAVSVQAPLLRSDVDVESSSW